jgi:two-component system, LytTR family, sensor kinase
MLAHWFLNATKKKVFTHTIGWLFFAGIFLLGLTGAETFQKSLVIVLVVFLPSIPAVYLHFYVFEKLLWKKKYAAYFLTLFAIVFLFGRLIELIVTKGVFTNDPEAYIASELTLGGFILVATGIRYSFAGIEAKNKLVEIEAKQVKAELDSLKMQVNPHFLFNSLNNIYGLISDHPGKGADSILTLSSLLRYLIYASQKSTIGLGEEIEFLEDYMSMERLRLGDKCSLSFEHQGDFSNRTLSPFLLIPFVENAFKHGSFATVERSFIHVSILVQNDRLYFNVKNSMKKSITTRDGGVGIANVKRRLELLLPDKYRLEVDHQEEIFNVNLEIELC